MNHARIWSLLAAACLLLSGCPADEERAAGDERDAAGAEKQVRLVGEDEIRALERQIDAIEANSRARTCPRPVLRGEPEPGRAADDMLALVEGRDDLAPCLDALEKNREALDEAFAHPKGYAPEGFPARLNRTARHQEEVNQEMQALESTCRPVIALIRRAVRHEDGCSPFLPGLHDQPPFIRMIRATKVAAAAARRAIAGGDPATGFDLLLDTLQFCQDLSRGGTSLLVTMIGASAATAPLAVLEHGLNAKEPLGAKLLRRVEDELGVLLSHQAHPAAYLRGEQRAMDVLTWRDLEEKNADGKTPFGTRTIGVDAREDMALAVIAGHETWEEILAGCKPEEPPAACAEHVRAVSERLRESKAADRDSLERFVDVAVLADKAKTIRRQIIDILKAVAAPDFSRYLARDGQIRFQLAALRLHAAWRRLAERKEGCPGPEAFEHPPLSNLRSDPYSGKHIQVEQIAPGKTVLRPPLELGALYGEKLEPAVFIDCPYQAR